MVRLATCRRPHRAPWTAAWLALCLHAAGVSGVPLPAAAGDVVSSSVPFACQDRKCGCRTVESCSQTCCCGTPARPVAAKTDAPSGIIFIQALACKGLGHGWFSALSQLPPRPIEWSWVAVPAGTLCTLSEGIATHRRAPPTPPPRWLPL